MSDGSIQPRVVPALLYPCLVNVHMIHSVSKNCLTKCVTDHVTLDNHSLFLVGLTVLAIGSCQLAPSLLRILSSLWI
jgi:hypothetical protein